MTSASRLLVLNNHTGDFDYLTCNQAGALPVAMESLATLATAAKQDDIRQDLSAISTSLTPLGSLAFVDGALSVNVANQAELTIPPGSEVSVQNITACDTNNIQGSVSISNTYVPVLEQLNPQGGFANMLSSMDLTSGQVSSAFDVSGYRDSVLSWQDGSVASSAAIDILASTDGTSYVFIGTLHPVKEGVSTVRRASAKLALAPFTSIKVMNLGAESVQGITCSVFSA